jgi:hypothetical protein
MRVIICRDKALRRWDPFSCDCNMKIILLVCGVIMHATLLHLIRQSSCVHGGLALAWRLDETMLTADLDIYYLQLSGNIIVDWTVWHDMRLVPAGRPMSVLLSKHQTGIYFVVCTLIKTQNKIQPELCVELEVGIRYRLRQGLERNSPPNPNNLNII